MIRMGDIRPELRRELFENIERAVNASDKGKLIPVTTPYPGFYHTTCVRDVRRGKNEKRYYIVVMSKWYGQGELLTFLILSPNKPKDMINTMVFEIDEKVGRVDMKVCLPKDIPLPKGFEFKIHSKKAFEDGKKVKLAY
jgi:hypothetical protein